MPAVLWLSRARHQQVGPGRTLVPVHKTLFLKIFVARPYLQNAV